MTGALGAVVAVVAAAAAAGLFRMGRFGFVNHSPFSSACFSNLTSPLCIAGAANFLTSLISPVLNPVSFFLRFKSALRRACFF